jgi:hypothetical protein
MAALLDGTAYQAGVWGNAPLMEWLFTPELVAGIEEDWQDYNSSSAYTLTQATSGTAAIDTTGPGRLKVDAGAATASQGVNLQRLKSAFLPAANKSIWAEFVLTATAASPPITKLQFFVGLAESDTTIFAAGSQTTANHIGWRIATSGLLVSTFASSKASTEATKTGPTLVDATQIRLGFRYDGVADTVQQYVNGVATGTAIATASVPKVVLYPSFVVQADGTDRPNVYLSAYRILQLR